MIRALIVDDHQLIRRGLKEVLAEQFPGIEVGEAEDSPGALALVTGRDWDIVLLDINIPGRSGLEVLQEVKRLRPKLPVLVLSVYSAEEFAIRSFKLGASGYLNKSGSTEELLAAVRKLLSGGKYITASLGEKLADALGSNVQVSAHESLSAREIQVLVRIAKGRSLKDIAAEMSLSTKTIATYRSRIVAKMGLASDVELTRYALQHKLVD